MMELLRPKNHKEKYAMPMEEIYGDLLSVENRAFYLDLKYFLESERANAIMALKTSDNEEARAKWKVIDKIFARYDNLRKEVTDKRAREQK